jgi:hypothetical protein
MLFSLVGAAALLSSCHFMGGKHISGNGHVITQQEKVSSFTRVEVSGSVKVHVRQDATASVRIETDENLMSYLDIHMNGNTVIIRTRDGFNLDPSKDIIAYVTAPAFENIDISGACDIVGDAPITGNTPLNMEVSGDGDIKMQVDLPSVSTHISGAGSVNLTGKATSFTASVSGSGDIKCFGLVTEDANLDLSGDSDAEVTANRKLDVSVSGSGDVRYKGSASVSQSISGSGSVKKEG